MEPEVHADPRGWFLEAFRARSFQEAGIRARFLQESHSGSSQAGTVRGLHFQVPPHAQGKLVRCTAGAVFDVAVDLRRSSPRYGRWASAVLSASNRRAVWIPPGFAHGTQTLEPQTEVLYLLTAEYHAPSERRVRWDDPAIGIPWPLAATSVGAKDSAAPSLSEADVPLRWGVPVSRRPA